MAAAADCRMMYLYLLLMSTTNSPVRAFIETPKFSQLRLLYPGYPEYGGHFHHDKLMRFILHPSSSSAFSSDGGTDDALQQSRHHTAAVRLSYAMNRYGGRHAIGTDPVRLSRHHDVADSFPGHDRQHYIFRNEAFGPFLAARYGNPEVTRVIDDENEAAAADRNRKWPMSAFIGRQGIVRVVNFRRNSENGHVGLWDCDRFYESRDWSTDDHVISVEFWESADSHCPPTTSGSGLDASPPAASPRRVDSAAVVDTVPAAAVHVVSRHNFRSPMYLHDTDDDDGVDDVIESRRRGEVSDDELPFGGRRRRTRRHHHHRDRLWLQ